MAPVRGSQRATRPVEWLVAILGGLALAAILVWLLRGSAPPETAPVQMPTVTAPPPAAPPISPPTTLAPTLIEATAQSSDGLKLRGIFARPGETAAAIIETADGRQRLYRAGSEIIPGVRLEHIGPTAVTLMTGSLRQTLGFGDTPPVQDPTGDEATYVFGNQRGTPGDLSATANDYRLGMKANKVGNETQGFVLKDVSALPIFKRAGLNAGDVIISVNGIALISEEKIIELPEELAGSNEVPIVFERGGNQQTVTVEIAR